MWEGLSLGHTNSFQTLWLSDEVTSRQDMPGVKALEQFADLFCYELVGWAH